MLIEEVRITALQRINEADEALNQFRIVLSVLRAAPTDAQRWVAESEESLQRS